MSMARLSRDQGRRDEAYDLLAPVYNWLELVSFRLWVLSRRAANCARLRSLTQTRLWLFGRTFLDGGESCRELRLELLY